MKKIIIALAAVAAFASCAKSEVEFTPEQQEIGLTPLTANRTKAMVATTAFPNEQFAVWAFYKQIEEGTSIADWQASSATQTTYIDEKPFGQTSTAGLWGGADATYFWPKEGSLMFVGYYPVSMKDVVTYSFGADVNTMTVAGYTPGNYQTTGFVNTATGSNHVEDFMYFNMTAASCDASTTGPDNSVKTGNHVDVVFRHALSWLTVVLKKDATTPAGATITVKDVYFTDVNTTGTGTVNNSPATGQTNEISWATTDADTEVYVLGGAAEDADNTTPLTEEYTCKEPILIPQVMDGNLVITYEIKSSDGSAFTETKTIPLSSLDDNADADNWEPGKKYTYTVTIGTSEILIDPVIQEWVPEPAEVNIQ